MREFQLWVCDFRTFDNSALGQFVTTDLLIMWCYSILLIGV